MATTTTAALDRNNAGDNGNVTMSLNAANREGEGEEILTFSAEVFKELAVARPTENILMSPLLLEATLALLYLGSDGVTAEQLKRQLKLQRFESNAKMANYYAVQLTAALKTASVATRLAFHNKFLLNENYEVSEEFQKIAQKYFHTVAERTSKLHNIESLRLELQAGLAKVFADSQTVSNSASVEHLIKDAVHSAIALMAVEFRNKWFLPFSAYRSGSYDFHLNCTDKKSITMLFDEDMFVKFGEFKELDARAIELPYEWSSEDLVEAQDDDDDELSMLLILPNKRDGLQELLEKLDKINLTHLTENRMQMESVQVLIPKFQIDFECSLKESLTKIGVSSIFSKEANFKNLLRSTCQEPLSFDDVLLKARIEVNETGSQPSKIANTKPIVISNSINGKHKFFRADHPFYFAIRSSSDEVYLMGQVAKF